MYLILNHAKKWLFLFLGYSIHWFGNNNYKSVVDEGDQTGFRVQSQKDNVRFGRNIKCEDIQANLYQKNTHSSRESLRTFQVYECILGPNKVHLPSSCIK